MLPTRRKALAWGAAAASVPALAGCGESPGAARLSAESPHRPGQKVTLQLWTWVPLQKSVDLWNRTHPDVRVEVQIVPANTSGGYQKMHASLKAGNPPDLAQVEYYALPEFMLVNGLTELGQFGGDAIRDSYVDWQWQQGVFGGKAYAVPQASGPMGFFYRRDLFERWGIQAPATWDAFRQAAVTVKRNGGGARICSFPPANAMWFSALAWQRGARWIRADEENDTWIVDVAGPETLEVADFWDGLIRDDLVALLPETQSPWYRAVQTGQLVSWIAAAWGDALLRGNAPGLKGKWRVAGLPQWEPGGQVSSNWGGSATAILQGSRHPVEALQFAHWLNTDPQSVDLLVEAGYGWPSAKIELAESALGRPDPFFGGQVYNRVFETSDRQIDTSWRWPPTTTQSFAHLNDAFGRALAKNGTLVDALRQAQGRIVDDLKAKGLKARSA